MGIYEAVSGDSDGALLGFGVLMGDLTWVLGYSWLVGGSLGFSCGILLFFP